MMTNSNTNHPAKEKSSLVIEKGPRIVIILSLVLLVASVLALVGYFYFLPKDSGSDRPLVLIHSPEAGAKVVIGEVFLVHASGRDDIGVTRMEFWVDGSLEEVENSSLEDGLNPLPMMVSWTADREGEIRLTFRAFNSRGVRSQSSILVEGILGEDRDRDGFEDDLDACPDVYGAGEDGCPLPGDGDGDGVLDADDLCLDAPGEEADLGCPDRDGDGVPDHLDADADEPGPADLDGAPDSDGDGVPDVEDLRPEDPGDPEGGGAPDTGAGDRDGDGAADDVDPCPDNPGLPEDGYCPPPEEDEAPEEEEAGGGPGEAFLLIPLEVEAYEFRVGNEYQNIWCYLQLGELPTEQYEFEPEGEREWNIREALAGANSVRLGIPSDRDLNIYLYCMGHGADGLLHEIGEYDFSHPQSDWNGRELIGVGEGDDGDGFIARYRICSPSCDETEIQPPNLHPITLGPRGEGPYQVRWNWEGDEDWLLGFIMMVNGNLVDSVEEINPDIRSLDLADFAPQCGEVLEFSLIAYGMNPGEGFVQRSPASNSQVWDGNTCPRTVSVSFVELDPSGRSDSPGPIYGSFYANDQRLTADFREGRSSFDATDDPEWFLDRIINIPLMFAEIEREAWSCIGSRCTSNYAPSSSAVQVDLGPRESLTFGASIWTEDDGRLFEGSLSIPAGEIVPGPYLVSNNGIDMTVMIDVLVGPEAGGEDHLPDLVVTEVTQNEESGQLGIHVFNNAADLIDEDIVIGIVRMSTNQELFLHTWENITMPSGSSLTLVSSEIVLDSPYDLRILLDPADPSGATGIRETNELNNIYETPVRMRVHINSFRVWQPCESFLDLSQSAEYTFRVWVSHRSPDGEVAHVGTRHHPWSGVLDYYWGEEEGSEHIGEWDLHENDQFTFEFDMPADHTLTVHADGYEIDPGSGTDDYAGLIFESYGPGDNYGHSDGEYHVNSEGWHECHDGTPLGWDTNNFGMWWTINRIH